MGANPPHGHRTNEELEKNNKNALFGLLKSSQRSEISKQPWPELWHGVEAGHLRESVVRLPGLLQLHPRPHVVVPHRVPVPQPHRDGDADGPGGVVVEDEHGAAVLTGVLWPAIRNESVWPRGVNKGQWCTILQLGKH